MVIYNLKINKKLILISISILIVILIFLFTLIYLNLRKNNKFYTNDSISKQAVTTIEPNNYTNILKEVYEDIDSYVGQSINFTGYVYKLYDLKNTEFVLARDMLINSDSQTVVVGFLCSCDSTEKFEEGTWVNITGTIIKGYYHNEIPVIDISSIQKVDKPDDCYVYPPDNTYIPTSLIL